MTKELTPREERLVAAATDIRSRPPGPKETAFLTRFLVQATLPHRQPKGNPSEWYRVNGHYTLAIRPGFTQDRKTRDRTWLGYPSGSIPRLLMFWTTTEALRTGSRKLHMGSSLSEFMRELGLNPRNGRGERSDAHRLRLQMERLFRATISFEYADNTTRRWCDMQVAPEGELWWDPRRPDEVTLWDSWLLLGERFYEAIVGAPIPLDVRALRELKSSPLALDLYAWLTYKTYQVSKTDRPQRVSWNQLLAQLGADYSSPKDFAKKARHALQRIRPVYPGLSLRDFPGGLIVRPGRTAIPNAR